MWWNESSFEAEQSLIFLCVVMSNDVYPKVRYLRCAEFLYINSQLRAVSEDPCLTLHLSAPTRGRVRRTQPGEEKSWDLPEIHPGICSERFCRVVARRRSAVTLKNNSRHWVQWMCTRHQEHFELWNPATTEPTSESFFGTE